MASVISPAPEAPTANSVIESSAERTSILIQAANDLLDEGGLEGLTIRAVLMRSGLARRAFYEQFSSKDDLVLAVFEQTLRMAAEHFRVEADEAGDPAEALRRIVVGIVIGRLGIDKAGTGRRSAALSREHLRLAESRPQDLQAALQPLLTIMSEQIAKGIAARSFRPADPDLQARLVYNFVAATIQVELLAEEGGKPDRRKRDELADTLWEFCRRAVIA
jgi:AcrR family transcriptional regulator